MVMIREAVVAGRFYPGSADECRRAVEACVAEAGEPAAAVGRIVGGIVPHAGWSCSGAVAA